MSAELAEQLDAARKENADLWTRLLARNDEIEKRNRLIDFLTEEVERFRAEIKRLQGTQTECAPGCSSRVPVGGSCDCYFR